MPRNMSFMLTTDQIRARTKTVTRRVGWKFLKPGDRLNACVKCQGLKRGEKIQRLASLVVMDVRRERLDAITPSDVVAEGFSCMTVPDFIEMFCRHMGVLAETAVTRIVFDYVRSE